MAALLAVVLGVLLTSGIGLLGWSVKVLIEIRVQLALLTDHQDVTNNTLTGMVATEKQHDDRIKAVEVLQKEHRVETTEHLKKVEEVDD